MKRTGRNVYLSGTVRLDAAEFVLTDQSACLQNILVDERRGYAYKVTFASTYPNVTNPNRLFRGGFGIYSYSRRELLRMNQDQGNAALGVTRSLASLNRNIGVVGLPTIRTPAVLNDVGNFQDQYVIKGDAMVTQSLAIGWFADSDTGFTSSVVSYYIELEEYEVSSDEEILLILNTRSQDAAGLIED